MLLCIEEYPRLTGQRRNVADMPCRMVRTLSWRSPPHRSRETGRSVVMLLHDTNVVSEPCRIRSGKAHPGVANWAETLNPAELLISEAKM